MAEEAGLLVVFRGDDGPLTKSLTDLQSQLKRFKAAMQDATSPESVARLNRAIEATGKRIKDLQAFTGRPLDNANKSLKDLGQSSNRAGSALIDLGRVAQDAPFGFIAIQNNLSPLIESFGRLSKESGGVQGALKAIGGSLLGPAGIGLAFSALTALVTAFQLGLFKSKDESEALIASLKKLGDQADITKDRLSELNENLSFINAVEGLEIQIRGGDDIQILEQQLKNQNEHIRDIVIEREILAEEISKVSASMFDVAPDANSVERKTVEEQLKKMNDAMLDSIREEAKASREAQLLRLRADLERVKAAKKTAKEVKPDFEFFNRFFGFDPGGKLSARQTTDLMNAANEFAKKFGDFISIPSFYPVGSKSPAINFARRFWAELQKGIVKFKPDAFLKIDLSKDIPEIIPPNQRDMQAAFTESMKQLQVGGATIQTPIQVDAELQKTQELMKSAEQMGKQIGARAGAGFDKVFAEHFVRAVGQAAAKGLTDKQMQEFKDGLVAMSSVAAEGIAGISNAFGDFATALVEGGDAMQAFGDSLINTFKQLAAQLIKNIILAGILSAISGGSTSFLTAFKGLMGGGGLPKFAGGGIVSGKTLAVVGEGAGTSRNNPEIIAPLDKLQNYLGSGNNTIVVNGKIKGNDILLSNNRTAKRNRRGG